MAALLLVDCDDPTAWSEQIPFCQSEGCEGYVAGVSGETVASATANKASEGIDDYSVHAFLDNWLYWQDNANNAERWASPAIFTAGQSKNSKAITYPTSAAADAREFVYVRAGWSAQRALRFAQSTYADIIRHERVLDIERPGELTLTPRSVVELSGVPGNSFNTRFAVDELTRSFSVQGGLKQNLTLKNHCLQSDALVV